MSDRIKGQRDSHGDNWSWGPPGGTGPPRGTGRPPPSFPWRLVLIACAVLALIGAGVALLVLADDDDSGSANGTTETESERPTRTRQSTQSPGAGTQPAQTPGEGSVRLLAWSRDAGGWVDDTLAADTGYREGDAIPVLLQIDQATPGSFYETIVRYECLTDRSVGFDFLTSPAEIDSEAVLADPGPGRERPDSTVPIPDDSNITFDDGAAGRFQLWGATFQQSLQGPLPPAACAGQKEFHLIAVAAGDTVSLVWAAHLASAEDWGEGKGSASADAPLTVEVTVVGAGDASLTVADGAIAP